MTTAIRRVAVLGAGSWGTAYAKVLADAGCDVRVWSRREPIARQISTEHANPEYLPGVRLPAAITASAVLDDALDGADAVALALPSQVLRENLTVFRELLPPGVPVISLAKGIEIGTGLTMSQVIEHVGHVVRERIVVLTGPNLAKEIADEQPTASLLACVDEACAAGVARASSTGYFRPYTTTDVMGAEIAGTGKNVIALAVGLADGLGFGGNASATITTRGLAELSRLGAALGARPATFAGLAGLGDLVATCSSPLSRNRSLGRRIGSGLSLDAATSDAAGQTAEGVSSCRSLRDLASRHGVDMPITEGVYRVCYQHAPAREVTDLLMAGPLGAE